jgi:hypothetical protein
VVLQVLIGAVEAEVEDDARTSRFATSTTSKAGSRRAANELPVGADRIHVRDRGAERDPLAIGELNPLHPAILDQQAAHVSVGPERHAKPFGQARQRCGHGAGAALRIPDALAHLHVRNRAQHRRGPVGRRTDVLDEVIEHLCDTGVMHPASDRAGDRRSHTQVQYVGKRGSGKIALEIDGVAQAVDRLPEVEAFGHLVQPLGDLEESSVSIGDAVARRERLELPPHAARIFLEVERRAVLEEAAPLRIKADEIELFLEPPVRFAEDAGEHPWHGQDRRSHVETETTFFEHGRFAAEPPVLLEQNHLVPARGQRARGSKPAQAAADDADAWVPRHHEALARGAVKDCG